MQKVFTKFRDPVNSFPLGEMNLGIMRPGRYSGFDTMEEISGLIIRIKHAGTLRKSSQDLELVTFGNLLTPQGSIIHYETSPSDLGLNLTVSTNDGNLNQRFDLVVCEHEYVQVVGGQPPVYFIQQGANDGTMPALSNPEKQVLIGVIRIAPDGYQYSDLTYTKSPIPLPGDATLEEYLNQTLNIPFATESQRGIIQLIDGDEVIESNEAEANNTKALTLRRLLLRTATTLRKGLAFIATNAKLLAGVDNSDIVTPLGMRRYAGITFKQPLTGNITINNSNAADFNGLVLIARDGSSMIDITIEKLNIRDFTLGVIGDTRKVRIIEGTDVTVKAPEGRIPQTVLLGSPMVIESDGVTNSGTFHVVGDLDYEV